MSGYPVYKSWMRPGEVQLHFEPCSVRVVSDSLTMGNHGLYALYLFLLISTLCICNSEEQLTFSKSWSPGGKRSEDNRNFQLNIPANAICHFLINQIRQMNACPNPQANDEVENFQMHDQI